MLKVVFEKVWRWGVVLCAGLIAVVSPVSTFALDASLLDMYAENNILFYDPTNDEDDSECGGRSDRAIISGDTAAEKVWTGLRSLGFTEEQTAGIMGNMAHESNYFNPAQHEGKLYEKYWPGFDLGNNTDVSYGLGLIQWSYGRRTKMYQYVKEKAPELIKYFENPDEYSKKNGNIYGMQGDDFIEKVGSTDADSLYSYELTYLHDETESDNNYKGIFDQNTVYDAAKYFLEKIEVPENPQIESHPERVTDAEKYYDQFKGVAVPTSISNSSSGENEDYEGNQVWTDEQWKKIQEYKPLYQEAAESVGIPWQMLAAVHVRETNLSRTNPSDNDDGIFQQVEKSYDRGHENTDEEFVAQAKVTARQLKAEMGDDTSDDAVKRAFFAYNGKASAYISQALDLGFSEAEAKNGEGSPYVMNRADKQRDPNYNTTTWGQIKHDHGGIEYPANNDYGAYVYYITAGGGSNICSTDNTIAQTAIDLAWKEGESGYGGKEPKDTYRNAAKEVGTGVDFTACSDFVATVMRYSESDKNFENGTTETERAYMEKHPELYTKIEITDASDTSILQPGDILQVNGNGGHGHIKFYVEIDGKPYTADASYGGHSGQLKEGITLSDSRGNFTIFRFKG